MVSTPTFYNGSQPRKKQNLLQAFQGQTSLRCESFDFKLKMSGWENCFHISSHTLPLLFFFFFFILVSRNLSLGGGYDENPETWPKFLVLLWSFSIFVNFFFFIIDCSGGERDSRLGIFFKQPTISLGIGIDG